MIKKGLAILLASLSVASCSPSGKVLNGTLTLFDYGEISGSWDDCEGTGGYSNVSAGNPITIKNQDGKIIGGPSFQNLDEKGLEIYVKSNPKTYKYKEVGVKAAIVEAKSWLKDNEDSVCVLYFSERLNEVPDAIEVVTRRGTLSYTKRELDEGKWIIDWSLGL